MNRKVTVTYDIPEELCLVFEQRAAAEGIRLEDVVAQQMTRSRRRREMNPQEFKRRVAAFERFFGAWDSGDEQSSDNERIDADLARQYGGSEQ